MITKCAVIVAYARYLMSALNGEMSDEIALKWRAVSSGWR